MFVDDEVTGAYIRLADAERGPAVSKVERARLCLTLDEVGPAAPTLAGSWTTHQLAAHLVLREGNLVSVAKAAAGSGMDAAVDQLAAESDFTELVHRLRVGPSVGSVFRLGATDRSFNSLEFFVHHEDVRRAVLGWTARPLPRWAEDQLWARLPMLAKLVARKCPVPVQLERSDISATLTARKGLDPAIVRGLPSELALYIHGRTSVAQVEFDGPADAVETLREQEFSV